MATCINDRFTKETSAATGKSERNIQRAAARGAALRVDPAAMNMLDMAMGSRQGERRDIVDNINEVTRVDRPTGTSAAAGLRRLRNAASKGNAQAAHELTNVLEFKKSVHRACVDAGLRKEPDTLSKLKSLWNKASQYERDAFDEWRHINREALSDV